MTKQYRSFCTRQGLIQSAAEIFVRAGFAESSITTISSRAGVSAGGLQFHFRNKQALGEAVEAAAAQTLLWITGSVQLRHPAPLQLLVDTSQKLARSLVDDPVLRAGFVLGRDATWRGDVMLWQQWQDWVQLMLTVARDQGSLAPDVVLEDAAATISAAVAGFEVLGCTDEEWRSRRLVTQFWRLMLPQLAAQEVRDELIPEGTGARAWTGEQARGDGRRAEEACGAA